MRVQVVMCAVALAAGCSGFPTFRGADIAAVDEKPGATITGPGYSLKFSQGGYHFPTSWVIGGEEVLAGSPPDCTDESAMGLSIHPFGRIDGDVSLPPEATASLTTVWHGPLAARVEIRWTAGDCPANGPLLGIGGVSTFTFVGDRISRLDEITGTTSTPSNACFCTSFDGFWQVTSFLSLLPDTIDGVFGAEPPTDDGAGNAAGRGVCVAGGGHQLAVAWPDETSRIRHVPLGNGDRSLGIVYDLVASADTTYVPPGKPAITTMLVNSDVDCDALRDRAIRTASSPPLEINGVSRPIAADGVYGGHSKAGDAPPRLSLPVTLGAAQSPVPGGFLVWLDLMAEQPGFRITRSPAIASREYRFQQVEGAPTQYLFWFPDDLAPGETITIEAP